MSGSLPDPKSIEEHSDCLDTQERKYIRYQKLQTNQLASYYVQSVIKYSTKDNLYAGLPPTT